MSNKVILVVLDGLNYQVARDCMGYLNGLLEQPHPNPAMRASLYPVQSELPSMSRPLYECILTGVRPVESGIVNNDIVRLSNHESIFSLAKAQGKVTAAAAYHWVSELYNRAPFNPVTDRFTHDESLNIQHGCFYHWDHYPDEALFLDAEHLRRTHQPDFLLIHPMNIDDMGHKYGLDSRQYRNSARGADIILSNYIENWLADGYQVLITSDHGMNNDLSHGGILPEEREVPLFVIGTQFTHQECHVKQTDLCGLVCQLLNLDHTKPYTQELLAL
ncbi:alkaline phosphatase family protein [Vibrio europaeus]|uniref:Alkaline phosphatase family protein n=1 Tax=Vibrio europaeus TaxID=300876 RepID=A0A178JFV5_9VIBR|nr:alkaline phosphatase family protein [Vibrio europaeus]MDC5706779.1 alkaline phosphatase family protein [Vibrio europaeus]MDC5712144.1 alkaline phosphatase family protein [Vibrio europaeus]MDC5716787.1 alkaline phosphatase family protein [Vibrio europaeus]MDC5721679.1 alkaline phosphatase family protein [Vibrio europaeus]MDC5726086.1 alkaline phosphatase family protein [Vibrio europaeus]